MFPRSAVLLACLASGCFFMKETATKAPDLHEGGSIMIESCGYSVTTHEGASRPETGTPFLDTDPTPHFVHVSVPGDPRTQMAVQWRTNDETTLASTVQFGKGTQTDQTLEGFTFIYDLATPLASGAAQVRMHEAHLCGLVPDTEYSYRVGGTDGAGKEAWSPVYTFRTAPDRATAPDAEVVMLVIGDTRDGYSTWGAALDAAFQQAMPDVILFSGDATTLGPIQDEWDAWFAAAEKHLSSTPMIVAHGNHDVNSVNFFSQFAMPGDEQNFAVDFGPVHLTVANDTPQDPADLQGANAQMLDANVKAGMTAPWNLLLHHKPMWTAAAGIPHVTDALLVRMAWQKSVDDAKVDVVFNGHDHDYERTKPMRGSTPGVTPADGTIYVVVGSAGAALYDAGMDFWTAFSQKTYSFAIVRARKGMFQMNAYRQDGTPLDSFNIAK